MAVADIDRLTVYPAMKRDAIFVLEQLLVRAMRGLQLLLLTYFLAVKRYLTVMSASQRRQPRDGKFSSLSSECL